MADSDDAGGKDGDVVTGRSYETVRATCSACSYSIVIHSEDEKPVEDSVFDLQDEHQEQLGNHHVFEFDQNNSITPESADPQKRKADG